MTDEIRKSVGLKELIEMEGNGKKFKYKGYDCEIKRNESMGHLCGYLELPFQKLSDELLEIPHGGVTYQKANDNGNLVIGFDCAHEFDRLPFVESQDDCYYTYCDMSFVEGELKKMVDYLEKEGIR
ncbi:hypothetical protein [Listeria fleischmannii]|uniref:hypothetical protein n=1 Tax=Listeria fleischmannii TaxID=1069827 RepID=UPI000254F9B6|nr:hypothetical protein [Listeria fleischmannii]EIA21386.1 hypothetical protein KKC_01312 [Listeria fleischmannii subsp. coloradonensis]STY35290.1 Uncharacterised protein [Listeria fleischmannii subsp. coloradonensis]